MDSELDRTLNQWDEKSCAEFEQYLDDVFPEESPYWHGLPPVAYLTLPEKWPWEEERRRRESNNTTSERF